MKPLFPGKSEIDQINRIFKVIVKFQFYYAVWNRRKHTGNIVNNKLSQGQYEPGICRASQAYLVLSKSIVIIKGDRKQALLFVIPGQNSGNFMLADVGL